MHSKYCLNCGRKFYPKKHIANQKYCSRKECQSVRKKEWTNLKLKNDIDYKTNKKEAQRRWRMDNPEYWKRYKKKMVADMEVDRDEKLQEECAVGDKDKNPILKIFLEKSMLDDLKKEREIDCDCKLILKP